MKEKDSFSKDRRENKSTMVAAAACLWHPSGANFDEIGAVYIAHYAVEIGEHRTRQRGISGATTGLVHYITYSQK